MYKATVLGLTVAALTAFMTPAAATAEQDEASAVSFGVDYTIVSDYIWRGLNFSEYRGEGREKLNHQLDVSAGVETPIGDFGGGVWFEWFAGQTEMDPSSDDNLQEVDYYVNYAKSLGPVSLEVGWIYYQFPQASGDAGSTNEVYASLGLDDSGLFGTEEAILNPTFTWYYDLDDVQGSWMELGVSHEFALADVEALSDTFAKDITITPSLTLGVDHRFTAKSTKLGNLLYGLDIGYDLSSALGMPAKYGSISITGFIAYSQSFTPKVRDDEFYGGVTLSYAQ